MLRLGLHNLTQPQPRAPDWIWIADHTIQLGREKCLVILGVRLSELSRGPLCLENMHPLMIAPCVRSNREVVYKQLEDVASKTGVPRAILSDGGSDLMSGIADFREIHPYTDFIYDITHKTSLELKHILSRDERWESFCSDVNQFKRKVQQTALAPLVPPSQRGKSRFMNVDVLMKWVNEILLPAHHFPDTVNDVLKVDSSVVAEKTAWVGEYIEKIDKWRELSDVAVAFNHHIRQDGYHSDTCRYIQKAIPKPHCDDAGELHETLVAFVQMQCAKARADECLPSSTEVLESLFGKYKYFEGEQARKGLCQSILAMGAMVSSFSEDAARESLRTIKTKDVQQWAALHFPSTTSGQRRRLRTALAQKEQKRHE